MAKGGGESGFRIARAYVEVEARVNEASVTSARASLTRPGGGLSPGAAPTPAPTAAPTPAAGPLGTRLATSRAELVRAGTEAARSLETGFKSGLASLSNMAVQQLRSMSQTRSPETVQTPIRTQTAPGAPRPAPVRPAAPVPPATISNQMAAAQQAQQRAQAAASLRQAAATQAGLSAAARPGVPAAVPSGGAQVINNYNTKVTIEPKFVKQLLDVITQVNQLKASNKAQRR